MLIQIVSVIQDELVGTSCPTLLSLPFCITSVLFGKGNPTLSSCITSAVIVKGYPVVQEELVGTNCYKLSKLLPLLFCIAFQIK